ncbi:MAG: hypothetical protein FWF03_00780 [Defluviitaleaceae bacterium]|nr:hypothetical protein [Defluviitaleaceae bacterium]
MAARQSVVLKGKKDGIDIWLDEAIEFDALRRELRERVSVAKRFFEDANTSVTFRGRRLSDAEEKSLIDVMLSETTLELSFVGYGGNDKPALAADEKTVKQADGTKPEDAAGEPSALRKEYMTAYYRGGLSFGQSIRYDGSVVVVGDANAGSEIVAGGNITVLGSLKGLVHAGASGGSDCFVSALFFAPTQLRIANFITSLPPIKKESKKTRVPTYAYVRDGRMYIVPLWD